MKIREIRAAGLRGVTPEGGWSSEIRPDDCVHTLIAVLTDEGLVGYGSVFSNDGLVKAALKVLEPLTLGENALEPERVSEKLHQHTFWLGRGGSITHAISGIDIALWDILGKATGQPVGRLLGGRYRERVQPYASILMQQPDPLADQLLSIKAQGFRAFKIGWGPFGRESHALDEAIVAAARDAVGSECKLMVDAGGSDAYWPQGVQVGAAHRRDARRARCILVRGAAQARCAGGLRGAAPGRAAARSPAARCSPGGKRSSRGWRPAHSTSCSRM